METERYKLVKQRAQEVAASYGEDCAQTEHLLLALLDVEGSTALRILDKLGVEKTQIVAELSRRMTRGQKDLPAKAVQFGPRTMRVFDLAMLETKDVNDNYLGTKHLLLALVREGEGAAGQSLLCLGVDLEKLRAETKKVQSEL